MGEAELASGTQGYFTIHPEHPRTDVQARHMALPVHPTQHMERNNILQELTKNKGQASTLTCALLLAQKGPEERRKEQSLQGTGLWVPVTLESRRTHGRVCTSRAGLEQPWSFLPLLMP